ncbi:uncharacterized protein PRCAT00001961001 [Priceomyces carsonii]|uniref:uncharacterized protein n=1 Tax=Priceomyces carsonii TaxID=28549 RepID=UPI002ED7B3EE|nr:unnamed protein product [Priceomyces carsonii]
MSTVGIDIGTASVRVCYSAFDTGLYTSFASDIEVSNDNSFITQSSIEIFEKILSMLEKIPSDFKSISVTATCSMVLLEKIERNSTFFLKPFSCDYKQSKTYNDVLLWMDNRAVDESRFLNKILDTELLGVLGGNIIPEMGLPKIKSVSDKFPDKKLIAFELYDWITYLLLVGGFTSEKLVPFNDFENDYDEDSMALDGSIKGWSSKFLERIGVGIQIGKAEFGSEKLLKRLNPIGIPIGRVHENITENEVIVCNGCIDCYAGWAATLLRNPSVYSNNLSMIAGTSTCFILSTTKLFAPIPGIWGPFEQLVDMDIKLFEFGQPATGKLFETLFADFSDIIEAQLSVDCYKENMLKLFEMLEMETAKLEAKRKCSIHEVIKYYFYYGDTFGNRSPYNDHSMGETIIDGANASYSLPSVMHLSNMTSLVIRYNLIIEFLCFQLMQILDIIKEHNGTAIDTVIISGSQADNTRFISLLTSMLSIPVTKILHPPSKYNVVRGSSIISLIGYKVEINHLSYSELLKQSIETASQVVKIQTFNPEKDDVSGVSEKTNLDIKGKRILFQKYNIFLDMAANQRRYREMINSISN